LPILGHFDVSLFAYILTTLTDGKNQKTHYNYSEEKKRGPFGSFSRSL
jgi:hypothetical protein